MIFLNQLESYINIIKMNYNCYRVQNKHGKKTCQCMFLKAGDLE